MIPAIEREVNEGENFAPLRQIVNSMILATWYKKTLKTSLLGQYYADQGKVLGVDSQDQAQKSKIYDQYIEAFKTGVFDFIKEEYDPTVEDLVPRKYFAGGVEYSGEVTSITAQEELPDGLQGDLAQLSQQNIDEVATRFEVFKDETTTVDFATAAQEQSIGPLNFSQATAQYFYLKQTMIKALDQENFDEYRQLREQMIAVVDQLGSQATSVSGDELVDTIAGLMQQGDLHPAIFGFNINALNNAGQTEAIRRELNRHCSTNL